MKNIQIIKYDDKFEKIANFNIYSIQELFLPKKIFVAQFGAMKRKQH